MVYGRLVHGMTLGVRAAVFDDDGWVPLVRHTYVPGWYFPGGGVAAGQSAEAAAGRKLMEEAGVALEARAPRLTVFRKDGDRWLVVAHANFARIAKQGCQSADPATGSPR